MFKTFLTCFLLVFSTIHAEKEKLRVAISDLKPMGEITQAQAEIITEQLGQEIISKGLFRVMERNQMNMILKEKEIQLSGICDESSCIMEMGQALGVSKLIIGSVGLLERVFILNIRLVDARTGELSKVAKWSSGKSDFETLLMTGIPDIINQLEKEVLKDNFGTVIVKTKPDKIRLKLDGKLLGPTPFENKKVTPGEHFISLTAEDYAEVDTSFTLDVGQTFSWNIEMKRSKGYKMKRLFIRQAIIGLVAASFAGAGFYMETVVEKRHDDQTKARNKYARAENGHDKLYKSYLSKREETVQAALWRDIMYGISGGFGVGFLVSFAF